MQQYSLDFTPPPLAQARAVGQVAGELAERRASRAVSDFSERAKAHILEQLGTLSEASGERLTDGCKAAGIKPPDDRAFGPVYGALVRENLIRCIGFVPRAKGHGTAGGRVWRLVR
jgi:hypothetical protein